MGSAVVSTVVLSSGLKPVEDGMAARVPSRSAFDAETFRALAEGSRDRAHIRRLLALSVISAGGSRLEAVEIGGVGL